MASADLQARNWCNRRTRPPQIAVRVGAVVAAGRNDGSRCQVADALRCHRIGHRVQWPMAQRAQHRLQPQCACRKQVHEAAVGGEADCRCLVDVGALGRRATRDWCRAADGTEIVGCPGVLNAGVRNSQGASRHGRLHSTTSHLFECGFVPDHNNRWLGGQCAGRATQSAYRHYKDCIQAVGHCLFLGLVATGQGTQASAKRNLPFATVQTADESGEGRRARCARAALSGQRQPASLARQRLKRSSTRRAKHSVVNRRVIFGLFKTMRGSTARASA